jgi:hypothetical protein
MRAGAFLHRVELLQKVSELQSICRAACVEQEDCPPAYACNGVSGTNLKSCQPA